MNEIKEIYNDHEQITGRGRERTNSDNFADNVIDKTHNEIKEDSIFSSLDDNIISFNLGTFGVLLTRRTLIKVLMFLVCLGLATLAWDLVIEGPTWYLEGRDADPSITWDKFVAECGHQTNIKTVN